MSDTNDKELLEQAAKAIGLEGCTIEIGLRKWNPLTDDGDALRLAVRLNLWESVRNGYQHVDSDNDLYAATRRAITRAAAEIGRVMT